MGGKRIDTKTPAGRRQLAETFERNATSMRVLVVQLDPHDTIQQLLKVMPREEIIRLLTCQNQCNDVRR